MIKIIVLFFSIFVSIDEVRAHFLDRSLSYNSHERSLENDQSLLYDESDKNNDSLGLSITPEAGVAGYFGSWANNINNPFSFGVLGEFPSIGNISGEIELGYTEYQIHYASTLGSPYSLRFVQYGFSQYEVGLNGKFYVIDSPIIKPFIGGGFSSLLYDHLYDGLGYNYYSSWVGALKIMTGAEVDVSDDWAIGARAILLVPILNKPYVPTDYSVSGSFAPSGYEEASLISSAIYKFMATVRIKL